MKKLVIEFSNERLITPSGLSLVGQMLGKSSFIKKCNNMKVDGKRSQSQIKNGDILLSYIGLLCQGKTSYDAIHEMSDDPEYYKLALGITRAIPSAETLRQRMDDIGASLREEILNLTMILPAVLVVFLFNYLPIYGAPRYPTNSSPLRAACSISISQCSSWPQSFRAAFVSSSLLDLYGNSAHRSKLSSTNTSTCWR